MKYDFILVGGGLSGLILSDYLSEYFDVLVLDKQKQSKASDVAAGIFNPVTGRRMVKTWKADEIAPIALDYYQNQEKDLATDILEFRSMKRLFHNKEQRDEWLNQVNFYQIEDLIQESLPCEKENPLIHQSYGGVTTLGSWQVKAGEFVKEKQKQLLHLGRLKGVEGDEDTIVTDQDLIRINGEEGKAIIYCEGWRGVQNPQFNWLPLIPNKGEMLLIECNELLEEAILQKGIFVQPLGKNRYKVGSTYGRNESDENASFAGKEWIVERLDKIIKKPYRILDQIVGVRPTVLDRRPLIGQHPEFQNRYIFNGFGSKGLSLIPWCAQHFASHLLDSQNLLNAELDISRFFSRYYQKLG